VRPLFRFGQILVLLTLVVIYVKTTFIDFRGNNVDVFSVSDYYSKNGMVTSIMDYLSGLFPPDAPKDYSLDTIREIETRLTVQNQKAKTPNVT
jgi:hypothetical protein